MPADTGDISETAAVIVARGAEEMGIELPDGAPAMFAAYYDLLEKRGHSVNLTAIEGAKDVAELHFLDSLALLNSAGFKNASVIDIGSGAGFPGVPLKIAEPTIKLALLDATAKRIAFLSELCGLLGIEAELIIARAEEAANDPLRRARFDIAVSRAVARLNVLCELCLPFVRAGGLFIAMKTIGSADELDEADGAIKALGGQYSRSCDYHIPGTDVMRSAVVIEKISDTPDAYPRRFSKIQKAPL